MTSGTETRDGELDIWVARGHVVALWIYVAILVALILTLGIIGGLGTMFAVVSLGVVIVGARASVERCWTEGDTLHVRRLFGRLAITRADIARFTVVGRYGGLGSYQRIVWAELGAGRRLRLPMTKGLYLFRGVATRDRRTPTDDTCDRLNAWLHG